MNNKDSQKPPPFGQLPAVRRNSVPGPTVRRLSLYLRELEALLVRNRETTSSKKLGDLLGLTDAQVRKDLAYFGQFGHPGVGYRVDELIARIRTILGTDRMWKALVVGMGHLGAALVSYRGFGRRGFEIVAAFDNDPAKIGKRVGVDGNIEIMPVERIRELVENLGVEIGIIAVPSPMAQSVMDALVEAGIKGVLNFAPATLNVPDGVAVTSVALSIHLEQLAFKICKSQVKQDK